ncbi:hypothetical protein [Rhodoflexus sp.]
MARESMLVLATGHVGVGKSHQTLLEIKKYIVPNPATGWRGGSVLIFDPNNEAEHYGFIPVLDFDIEEENPRKRSEALRKVVEANKKGVRSIYRVIGYTKAGQPMSIQQKLDTAITLLQTYKNGLLLLEDTRSYIKNFLDTDIVSKLLTFRHSNLDIIIHLQSLSLVSPQLFQAAKIVRFHKQLDEIDRYKDRVPNYQLFKIAQNLVNRRYREGENRFFVYVHADKELIQGKYTEDEFRQACAEYLYKNQSAYTSEQFEIAQRNPKTNAQKLRTMAQKEWTERHLRYMAG